MGSEEDRDCPGERRDRGEKIRNGLIRRADESALDYSAPQQFTVYKFPAGFLWGAATSSHQVEGDNRWNDWWEYEQSGCLPHKSGEACRHYERFEQDFDLARSWA